MPRVLPGVWRQVARLRPLQREIIGARGSWHSQRLLSHVTAPPHSCQPELAAFWPSSWWRHGIKMPHPSRLPEQAEAIYSQTTGDAQAARGAAYEAPEEL